jgi:hypothetical protein
MLEPPKEIMFPKATISAAKIRFDAGKRKRKSFIGVIDTGSSKSRAALVAELNKREQDQEPVKPVEDRLQAADLLDPTGEGETSAKVRSTSADGEKRKGKKSLAPRFEIP